MSDVPETPDGAAEAAQGAVEHAAQSDSGFDGPFDEARARQTIDSFRSREKEWEPKVKQFDRLGADPDALADYISGLPEEHRMAALQRAGYEFEPDEPDYTDAPEDDSPLTAYEQRLAAMEAKDQQRDVDHRIGAVTDHIDNLAKEAGAELTDYERSILLQRVVAVAGGVLNTSTEATEQAFKEHLEWLNPRIEAGVERRLESKRAPAPPLEGKQGEPQIDPWDAKARQERIAARLTAEES